MKLIFAQGNPGDKFNGTRHNVGFQLVDELAAQQGTSFTPASKFFANLAEYTYEGQKVIVAKPDTFYNETGRSFAAIKQFYKLDDSDILVIHDELALPFGTIRSRIGGSDAGNNGIKSINAHGGDTTARLRIGIGNELRARMGDVDFVLGRFSKEEQAILSDVIMPKCLEVIHHFVTDNHQVTSHTVTDPNPQS